MKIIENKILEELRPSNVRFIRIDPEDLTQTLSDILISLLNLSWLNKFDEDFEIAAFRSRATKTIEDIKDKFSKCTDDSITSDAGEYVVSELSRKALINELNYLDIPLGELLGKKRSGNPGFDFHSQNPNTDTVIFGEAKYVASRAAYSSALPQIRKFIQEEKDIEDLPELKPFCTTLALHRALDGNKGFAAAFSAKSKPSVTILDNIKKRDDFQEIIKYEEVILLAVNI